MLDPNATTTIDSAIARAHAALLASQDADGRWRSWCDQGPAATAQVLVGLHFARALDPEDARDAAAWLVRTQREDGSFVAHPFASEGDVSSTAYAWAGLRAAGLADDAEPVRKAKRFVDANGGATALVDRMQSGDMVALFLVMMDLLQATALPEPPQLFTLLPPLERFVERRFTVQMPFMLLEAGILLHVIRGDWGREGKSKGLIGTLEADRCVDLLDSFQNADGSWMFGDTLHAALSLATLHAIGIPADDPRVVRGREWLDGQKRRDAREGGLWYSIFQGDVWSTAFVARALVRSGLPASHPAIVRARDWLVRTQIGSREPAASPPTDRVAWAFQIGNTTMADCDDTGVVLISLGIALARDPSSSVAMRESVARSVSWLEAMQNPDGGWASFQRGSPGKAPGPMMTGKSVMPGDGLLAKLRFFLHPPPDLGDPSTEDVTGRVLLGLAQNGYSISHPCVIRATAFLRTQQCPSGAWWGRWVVNYLAGTSWVLRGLAAVGADMSEPWIANGVRFLLAHSNRDGGWGESVDSYRDESLAGVGPSSAGLTGLVVTALVESGQRDRPEVAAGVRYLLAEQSHDGTWPNGTLLHALVPPDLFYVFPGTADQLALEALGAWKG